MLFGYQAADTVTTPLQKRWFSTEILIDPCRVYNTFHVQRHLTSAHGTLRAAAMTAWREAVTAARNPQNENFRALSSA
jgi:hypothetical protein